MNNMPAVWFAAIKVNPVISGHMSDSEYWIGRYLFFMRSLMELSGSTVFTAAPVKKSLGHRKTSRGCSWGWDEWDERKMVKDLETMADMERLEELGTRIRGVLTIGFWLAEDPSSWRGSVHAGVLSRAGILRRGKISVWHKNLKECCASQVARSLSLSGDHLLSLACKESFCCVRDGTKWIFPIKIYGLMPFSASLVQKPFTGEERVLKPEGKETVVWLKWFRGNLIEHLQYVGDYASCSGERERGWGGRKVGCHIPSLRSLQESRDVHTYGQGRLQCPRVRGWGVHKRAPGLSWESRADSTWDALWRGPGRGWQFQDSGAKWTCFLQGADNMGWLAFPQWWHGWVRSLFVKRGGHAEGRILRRLGQDGRA